MPTLVVAAGYGTSAGGTGSVESFWHDTDGLHRADSVALGAPSFLAWHPNGRTLYAVNELPDGKVSQLAVAEDGALEVVRQVPSGGDGPCHLALDPRGRTLFVANYGDGVVGAVRVRENGDLDDLVSTVRPHGSGPVKDRQAGPHAHMAFSVGANLMGVVDLGTDTIRSYHVTDEGVLRLHSLWPVPPGTGPRQLAFFPSDPPPGIGTHSRTVVIGELSSAVLLIRGHQDGNHILHRLPATVARSTVPNFPAQLHITQDGSTVYISNRGADVITQFAAEGESLRAIADYPCGGAWPRHFSTAHGHMYVANQYSDRISVLRIEEGTGALCATELGYDLAGAACVLPR